MLKIAISGALETVSDLKFCLIFYKSQINPDPLQ